MSDTTNLQLILSNAQSTANKDGYDYTVFKSDDGYGFTRKSEFERDKENKRKIIVVNPE